MDNDSALIAYDALENSRLHACKVLYADMITHGFFLAIHIFRPTFHKSYRSNVKVGVTKITAVASVDKFIIM